EPAVESNPTEKTETEETQKKVQQALDLLEEGDRQIILLKDLQGHSYDEIADIMQIPKGTVRSRLHRARLELKAKLKPYIGTLTEDGASYGCDELRIRQGEAHRLLRRRAGRRGAGGGGAPHR